jgi:hypothetical protein
MQQPEVDAMSFDLGDYVPVAERIVTFYELHPEGRIVCTPPEATVLDGQWFITATCSVWKSDKPEPDAVASAWEPYPGKTTFTRDSEAMNAETSAIGRALGAAGVAVKRSLATSDEVQLRQGVPAGVHRSQAKKRVLEAVGGDREAAVDLWARAFPDDPDSVDHAALSVVCLLAAPDVKVEGDEYDDRDGATPVDSIELGGDA